MADDKKIIKMVRPPKKVDEIREEYLNEAIDMMKDHIKDEQKTKKASPSARRKKPAVVQTATGNGNTQVAGDLIHNHYQSPPKNPPKPAPAAPPDGTIGGNGLLRHRIQTLMNTLGDRRKERFGKNGFAAMYRNFKKDFKIKNNEWTCIWLWPEKRADEIIQYFEEKLGNTIQGRIETAAARPDYRHTRRQLFAKERKILDELGLSSDDQVLRDCMNRFFGVTSRRDMSDEQLANWVSFLDQEAEKAYSPKN